MMRAALAIIAMGLLVFYAAADFEQAAWQHAYGLWDKAKDVLLLALVGMHCRPHQVKYLQPLFLMLIVRLLWEGISWLTGFSINNTPAVGWLFAAACIVVWIYLIKR